MPSIPCGVYPTMITPFTEDNRIDFDAVDRIVEFYARAGCQGIFSVCQSSEMFFLSLEEREALARRVVQASTGRMCIIASGHISDEPARQVEELVRIRNAGVDAVVLVSNRLAAQDEDDDVLIERLRHVMRAVPDILLGMYECPHPYKRLLSDKVLEFMAQSGRFAFIKDTCCDAALIKRRIRLLNGRVQLFNANTATLLDTLRAGADGFSGIMGNLHPDLYVWMYRHYQDQPAAAERVSALLTLACEGAHMMYPTTAKYHMNRVGIPMSLHCRCQTPEKWNDLVRRVIDSLIILEEEARAHLAP